MTDPKKNQVGGDHYRIMAITPTEYIIANGIDWLPGNAIKYLSRYKNKGGREDVLKAIHYCQLLVDSMSEGTE